MPPPSSGAAMSIPAAAARPVCGSAPMPTRIACAGCSSPSSVWAASTMPSSPSTAVTEAPKWKRTPRSMCSRAKNSPSSGPSAPYSGVVCGSTTVTSAP